MNELTDVTLSIGLSIGHEGQGPAQGTGPYQWPIVHASRCNAPDSQVQKRLIISCVPSNQLAHALRCDERM